jgi:hypothetical protein
MKTNKFSLLLVCLMALGFFFASCGGGKSDLVGRWYKIEGIGSSMPEEVELLKDKTGFILKQAVTWKTENKRLYITHPNLAMAFDYKLTGSMLELSNDDDQKFVYVKEFGGESALVSTWESVSYNGEPIADDEKTSLSVYKDGTFAEEGEVIGGKWIGKWIAEGNLLYLLYDDKRIPIDKCIFEMKGRTLTLTAAVDGETYSTEYKKI